MPISSKMTIGVIAITLGLMLVVKLVLDQGAQKNNITIEPARGHFAALKARPGTVVDQTTPGTSNIRLDSKSLALNAEELVASVKDLRSDIESAIDVLVQHRRIITNNPKYGAFIVDSLSFPEQQAFIDRLKLLSNRVPPEKKSYLNEMEKHVIRPLLDEFSKPLCVDIIVDNEGFASWSTWNTDDPSDVETNDLGVVLKREGVIAKASLYSAEFERRYGQVIPDKVRKTMEDAKAQAQPLQK